MKKRRVFDEAFKRITVDLFYAKGSVHEASRELGIVSIAAANRSHYQMATVGRCRRFTEVLLRLPLFPVG